METTIFVSAGLLSGALAGFLAAWAFFRVKRAGEDAVEQSVLEERIGNLESRLQEEIRERSESRDRLEKSETELEETKIELATAREQAKRLVEVEEKYARAQESLTEKDQRIAQLETTLDQERKVVEEKLDLLKDTGEKLKETFSNLAGDALKTNNQSFLDLAKTQLEAYQKEAKVDLEKRQEAVAHLLSPVKESFQKFDKKIEELEKGRSQDYGGITEQLKALAETQQNLRAETGRLVNALRRPQARGQWGESQLRNVVELAGMNEHCDFQEQVSTGSSEGNRLRPDLIVHLPGGKRIVVDAKVSLDAYLNAIETEDEERRRTCLGQHAQQVRAHIQQLSKKEYWKQFDFTPDFVVLFLPGEVYFSAAVHEESSLIEEGARNRVILASPTTLIALLKAVAYGWQQEMVAENAREIAKLGKDLHDRVCHLAGHFEELGRGLKKATEAYNRSIATLESRVLVSTRRFRELQVGSEKEMPQPLPVEVEPKKLMVVEGGDR